MLVSAKLSIHSIEARTDLSLGVAGVRSQFGDGGGIDGSEHFPNKRQVTNFERSLKFHELLGFKIVCDLKEVGNLKLDTGLRTPNGRGRAVLMILGDDPRSTRLDVIQWKNPPTEGHALSNLWDAGLCRIALRTRTLIQDYEELKAKGVESWSEPQVFDVREGRQEGFVCCTDPDGTVIELTQVQSGGDELMADAKMINYEEVAQLKLEADACERLLSMQTECAFCWSAADGWPIGIVMSYVQREGPVWMTASSQRPRVGAVKRDDRVSVVVSSAGTSLPPQTVTIRGRCKILEDPRTKAWFYPALAEVLIPGNAVRQQRFIAMLDSPRRVVMAVQSEKPITFDSVKMGQYRRAGAEPPKGQYETQPGIRPDGHISTKAAAYGGLRWPRNFMVNG